MDIQALKSKQRARTADFLFGLAELSMRHGILLRVKKQGVRILNNDGWRRFCYSYVFAGSGKDTEVRDLEYTSVVNPEPQWEGDSTTVTEFSAVNRSYRTIEVALIAHAQLSDEESKEYLLLLGLGRFALVEASEIKELSPDDYTVLEVKSGLQLGGLPPLIRTYVPPFSFLTD